MGVRFSDISLAYCFSLFEAFSSVELVRVLGQERHGILHFFLEIQHNRQMDGMDSLTNKSVGELANE